MRTECMTVKQQVLWATGQPPGASYPGCGADTYRVSCGKRTGLPAIGNPRWPRRSVKHGFSPTLFPCVVGNCSTYSLGSLSLP